MTPAGLVLRASLVVVLAGGNGCGASSGVKGVTGSLVCRTESGPLWVLNLRTMRSCDVLPAQDYRGRLGGVSKVREDAVALSQLDSSGVPEVVVVQIPSGGRSRLGEGSFPTATTSGAYVVWYQANGDCADSVALVRRRTDGGGAMDTLAYVANLTVGGGAWWTSCAAPVALDSDWVAVAGVDGSVWRVDAVSRAKVRMGGEGLRPEYWQGVGFEVICRRGPRGGVRVLLSDQGVVHPIKALRWLAGYAQLPGESRVLAVLPGPPRLSRLIADSWRLVVYDRRDGRTAVLSNDVSFAGSAAWLREGVACP